MLLWYSFSKLEMVGQGSIFIASEGVEIRNPIHSNSIEFDSSDLWEDDLLMVGYLLLQSQHMKLNPSRMCQGLDGRK